MNTNISKAGRDFMPEATSTLGMANNLSQAATGLMSQSESSSVDTPNTIPESILSSQPQSSTFEAVTEFIDDVTPVISNLSNTTITLPAVTQDEKFSSIYAFLRYPVVIEKGTWSSTTPALTPNSIDLSGSSRLFRKDFPQDYISGKPGILSKIENYAFIRADVVVRLQINAQPFQCGKVYMCFSPFQNVIDQGPLQRKNYLAGRTGFAGVEMNIPDENSVVLRIPFCSYNEAFNLITGEGTFGSFSTWVTIPLSSGDVSYTVYAHLENVHLSVPAPVTLSLLDEQNYIKTLDILRERNKKYAQVRQYVNGRRVEMQGILENLPKPSAIFNGAAAVSNALSNVPVIGSAAKVGAVVATGASKIADAFGFTRTPISESSKPMAIKPMADLGFVAGNDNSTVLACYPDTQLSPPNTLFATEDDEMSFPYIKKRPTVLDTFNWSVDNAEGDVLFKTVVAPIRIHVASSTRYETMLSYLSNPFCLWRGSIHYRLSFAKTKFNSGRIRIAFIPGMTTAVTYEESEVSYSKVLDLSSSSTIDFEVPFVSSTPWKEIHNFDSDFVGTIAVYVVNKLKSVTNAPSTITALVWVRGGDDFELGLPGTNSMTSGINVPFGFARGVEMQGDESTLETNREHLDTPMLDTGETEGYSRAMCTGEFLNSVKAYINRYTLVGTVPVSGGPFQLVEPFSNQYCFAKDSVSQISLPNMYDAPYGVSSNHTYSAIQYFSALYRFCRGGIRYKITFVGNRNDNAQITVNYQNANVCSPVTVQTFGPGNCVEFIIPHYYWTSKKVLGALTNLQHMSRLIPEVTFEGFLDGYFNIYMSASNDFAFGWLLGPSPTKFVIDKKRDFSYLPKPVSMAAEGSAINVAVTNTPDVSIAGQPIDVSVIN